MQAHLHASRLVCLIACQQAADAARVQLARSQDVMLLCLIAFCKAQVQFVSIFAIEWYAEHVAQVQLPVFQEVALI